MTWKIETECHNCYWLYTDFTTVVPNKICGHKDNGIGICKEESCPIKSGVDMNKKAKLKGETK